MNSRGKPVGMDNPACRLPLTTGVGLALGFLQMSNTWRTGRWVGPGCEADKGSWILPGIPLAICAMG